MENMSLSRQAVVLLLTLFLFWIYYFSIFRDPVHNSLALAFSIVSFLWLLTIVVRYHWDELNDCKKDHRKIVLPVGFKCCIGDSRCEDGDINFWALIHVMIYITVGYFIPHRYFEILIISIICELIESAIGHTSKMVADPIINLTAYAIGSHFSRC
jgi:hypothetical protein